MILLCFFFHDVDSICFAYRRFFYSLLTQCFASHFVFCFIWVGLVLFCFASLSFYLSCCRFVRSVVYFAFVFAWIQIFIYTFAHNIHINILDTTYLTVSCIVVKSIWRVKRNAKLSIRVSVCLSVCVCAFTIILFPLLPLPLPPLLPPRKSLTFFVVSAASNASWSDSLKSIFSRLIENDKMRCHHKKKHNNLL